MRISDHNKWKDKRHRHLSKDAKLIYDYLWDNASKAGFYKIADPEMDAFTIGCTIDEFWESINELSKPKEILGGEKHRGFVLVDNVIWISHLLKHDQQKFGQSLDNAHTTIVKELISYHNKFSGQPEYDKLIDSILPEVLDKAKVKIPVVLPDIPDSTERFRQGLKESAKPSGTNKSIDMNWFLDQFKKVTGKNAKMNRIIEKNIRDRVSEGIEPNDVIKVYRYIHKEWSQDEKMKQHIVLETILGEKFPKYLSMAMNEDTTQGYVPAHRRNK